MENLILFRSQMDELDENEFKQFIMKLIESNGRDILVNSLFDHFKQSPKSINPITNIATKIINSRDASSEFEVSYDCIDKLPSSLIGECASFLSLNDYLAFTTANRNIYIGCYSPPRLYRLDLDSADSSKLKQLTILNNIRKFMFGKVYVGVKSLCDARTFCNILRRCHHVEYLSLHSIKLTNYDELNDTANIKKWLPNLKAFCCTNCKKQIPGNIIPALCDQLEILVVDRMNTEDLENQNFPKLEELQLFPKRPILTKHVFMNVTSLKRIDISLATYDGDEQTLLSVIDNVIGKQLSLQHVKLVGSKWLSLASVLTNSALSISSNPKRESQRLNMEFYYFMMDNMDCDDIISSTMELVTALESSTIEMFRVRTWGMGDQLIDEDEIVNVKQNYFVQYSLPVAETEENAFGPIRFELIVSNSKNEITDNAHFSDTFHFDDELNDSNFFYYS